MSTEDFATNNQDHSNFAAGRGLRNRTVTPGIGQYNAEQAKKAASLTRRRARTVADAGFRQLGGTDTQQFSTPTHTSSLSGQAHPSFAPMLPPSYPSDQSFQLPPSYPPDQSFQRHAQDQYYPQYGSSPNPFQPPPPTTAVSSSGPAQWEHALQHNQLFTLPNNSGPNTFDLDETDADEEYADPEADFPDPNTLSAGSSAGLASLHNSSPQVDGPSIVNNLVATPQDTSSAVPSQLNITSQNLRVFPQDTPNMTSVTVNVAPRRLIRRAPPGNNTPSQPSPLQPSADSPRPALIRRLNIFGPGRNDDRHRPRSSTDAANVSNNVVSNKENAVHHLSDQEEDSTPCKKLKSRKEPAARSIAQVEPERAPPLEAGYTYIRLQAMTDEKKMWLNSREELAEFSQEAFEYGLNKLDLDHDAFEPVKPVEQNLNRERIYGVRGDFKEVAREVVKGPDGFDLWECGNKATAERQRAVQDHNRDEVAMLLHKSAFGFLAPTDRAAKGTMLKNASIEAVIKKAVFANLLSDGMQHPDFFDDSLPEGYNADDDDDQSTHKPTFPLVTLALVLTAIRAAIMEYSSGHFIAEAFTRKIFKPHFDAELKTLRAWHAYTSEDTLLEGDGPPRRVPPSFLTRMLQEDIVANARYSVLKDVVAPIPSTAVMDETDFALNQ